MPAPIVLAVLGVVTDPRRGSNSYATESCLADLIRAIAGPAPDPRQTRARTVPRQVLPAMGVPPGLVEEFLGELPSGRVVTRGGFQQSPVVRGANVVNSHRCR